MVRYKRTMVLTKTFECPNIEQFPRYSMAITCSKGKSIEKQRIYATLGHPKAECYSLQHYVPPYTSDNYSCILEIHPWPWHSLITQLHIDPHRDASCRKSTFREQQSKLNTVKTFVYSSQCSLFAIDVPFVPVFIRIKGQTLHSEFHLNQINPSICIRYFSRLYHL